MIFLMGVLATWRITALLVYGRWGEVIRYKLGTHMLRDDGLSISPVGRVLQCFWCTSLMVALPFAGLCGTGNWQYWLLWVFALSGGAILLNHLCRINLYAEKR